MRHRNRRLATIALAAVVLISAVGLGLFALRDAVVFFYSPSEIVAERPDDGERIRVGGLVEEESILYENDGVAFYITDRAERVRVIFTGLLPDLFKEGKGVIAEGEFQSDGIFHASVVLAKHDENYMPPEVAEALRDAGVWQGEEPQ